MDYKTEIAAFLKERLYEGAEVQVGKTAPGNEGDYSVPCFRYAGALRRPPNLIAADLAQSLNDAPPAFVERAEAVGGYLNIFLKRVSFAADVLQSGFKRYPQNGKTVCIDYSSVNIAKPFHIGHLLTTVIGGSLYRIFQYLGFRVVGINHLGDYGTQFGKLITAYLKWGEGKPQTMESLLALYVRFHAEAEKDESLNDEARLWFKKIENGDEKATAIFRSFKETTLKEVDKVYRRLGITFDSYNGESFYNDKMGPVVDELRAKNLLTESEGAYVVEVGDGMPPCLILKSDGASLYATRDLAAAIYRKTHYDFDKNLYVVAYQQNLHFKQVFKVLELMGRDWAKDCVHVPFGMVSLENATLSTRHGNVVFLKDVLDTAVKKTLEIIDAKNPALEDKQRVAEQVGVGAVVFGGLSTARIKDMVFSYDKALNFDGETGPYLQYTHARCCSVLQKAVKRQKECDYRALSDDTSYGLVKQLTEFDDVVGEAAEKYEPSVIARYLINLSQSFNKFYFERRILGEEGGVAEARLRLTEKVRDTLKKGLWLLLIEAPERM